MCKLLDMIDTMISTSYSSVSSVMIRARERVSELLLSLGKHFKTPFKMLSLRQMICAFVSTLVALSSVSGGAINLEHISTIYIPYSYLSTPPRVDIDSGAVEQFAFDAPNGYAYVIGDAYLQIVDYANLTKPEIVYNHSLAHRSKDVAHCGPFVAYLLLGSDTQEPGTIYIYRKYNSQTGEFTKLHEQTIGSYPSMLTFTPDCRKILTADEGTAGDDATEQYFLNPEGMVSIIEIKGDFADPCFDLNDVTFNDFDDRRQKYADLGVRFPYNGYFTNYTEQTLSESVEPEYIAVNPRDNVAYVNLQENNAIAVLDLGTESIVKIVPLGTKSWLNLSLDPSDRDDGIIFQTGYDIKSFYMPNAIKYFGIDGVGYIATADEGSDLDYGFDRTHWGDNRRGESILDDGQLASTVSQSLREALIDESRLGRLQFSITDGLSKTEEDKIEELFFFGGRGFSILRADHLTRVYDSGDDIERVVAQNYKEVFNSDTYPGLPDSQSPRDLADKRSDNKGPECEAVEVGVVNGKTVLFVGVRKGSVIAIYTVAADGQATFDSVHRQGGMNRTFEQLLNDRDLGDLDPKDIEFVPADQNQANRPLLMVAGAASGTLSLYYVNGSGSSTSDSDTMCRSPMGFILSFLVSILAALVANS